MKIKNLVELPNSKAVADRKRDLLDPEFGFGDLVLIQLTRDNRHAVQRGGEVLASMESDERGVHSVTGPTKRTRFQISYGLVSPLLARADGCKNLLADWMLLDGAFVLERRERIVSAVAGSLEELPPKLMLQSRLL